MEPPWRKRLPHERKAHAPGGTLGDFNAVVVHPVAGGRAHARHPFRREFLLRLADRVVWLQTAGERTERAVAFTVAGGGAMKYLVTDLGAGAWQVWRDGKIVRPAARVAESEGTMYFEGPAGNNQLRR